ncbi:MAG: PadR family transcriptional regulator [archaeon]|nr:MAG: PadR family transcriptional regulator [archaeon]
MALEHLRSSLTKGNLWLYILAELKRRDQTPGELRAAVERGHSFSPAPITFYSVIYKLRREGLVRKTSQAFRSPYSITPKGRQELAKAIQVLSDTSTGLEAH